MGAKHNIDDPKRPSVEALLHNLSHKGLRSTSIRLS